MKTTLRIAPSVAAPAAVPAPVAPAAISAPRTQATPADEAPAFANRETWLVKAIALLDPAFAVAGQSLPMVHASVGFGYGTRGSSKNILGQCWDARASADRHAHVFVSPTVSDSVQALAVLAHELAHATLGTAEGHGARFRALAHGLGLTGPMRSTVPGPAFLRLAADIVAKLGAYPHPAISMQDREAAGLPKQSTRMLKFVCSATGYTVRTTQKWVRLYGAPISPANRQPMTAA